MPISHLILTVLLLRLPNVLGIPLEVPGFSVSLPGVPEVSVSLPEVTDVPGSPSGFPEGLEVPEVTAVTGSLSEYPGVTASPTGYPGGPGYPEATAVPGTLPQSANGMTCYKHQPFRNDEAPGELSEYLRSGLGKICQSIARADYLSHNGGIGTWVVGGVAFTMQVPPEKIDLFATGLFTDCFDAFWEIVGVCISSSLWGGEGVYNETIGAKYKIENKVYDDSTTSALGGDKFLEWVWFEVLQARTMVARAAKKGAFLAGKSLGGAPDIVAALEEAAESESLGDMERKIMEILKRTPAELPPFPVETSQSPVEPSQSPAEPSQSPAEPSQSPVEPSQSPVEPSPSPVEPSPSPVEPSQSPEEPSQSPEEPSPSPAT